MIITTHDTNFGPFLNIVLTTLLCVLYLIILALPLQYSTVSLSEIAQNENAKIQAFEILERV
jgi:hypothetical protein